jgi:hypothetical protein
VAIAYLYTIAVSYQDLFAVKLPLTQHPELLLTGSNELAADLRLIHTHSFGHFVQNGLIVSCRNTLHQYLHNPPAQSNIEDHSFIDGDKHFLAAT